MSIQQNMTPISNPLSPKLEAMIKNLTTPQLMDLYKRQATNPKPDYKLTLILGELNNREDLDKKMQQMPTSTVAQDVMQRAMPQPQQQMPQQQMQPQMQPQQPVMQAAHGGLAELHVPDHMFQEHNMAGGGIVAFDEGGHVPRFDGVTNGSLVSTMPNYASSLQAYQNRRAQIMRRLQELESSGQAQIDEDRAGMLNAIEAPGRWSTNAAANLVEGVGGLASRVGNFFTGKPTYEARKQPHYPKQEPESEKLRAELENIDAALAQTEYQGNLPIKNPTAAAPAAGPAAGPAGPQVPAGPGLPSLPSISTKLGRATSLYTPEVLRQLEESRKPVYLDEKTYVPPELSVDDAAKRVKDVQAAFGVSEKPYEEQSARLKKRGEDLEAKGAQNKWDALIAGGLSMMASKNPNFLAALGEGGIKGLQTYTDAQDKLEASREKLDTAQFALADAQNRFRQEGSKEAAADLRENRNEIRAAKREFARDKVTADRAANVFKRDDIKTVITEEGRVQTTNLGQESKEADLQYKQAEIALQRAGLNIQSFNAQTQRIVAQRPDLVSTVLSQLQSDPTYQAADGQTKADMFAKVISGTKAQGTSGLSRQVLISMDRARERFLMNPRYLKAQKDGDKKTMQEIEQEEFRKIPGYDAVISGLSTAGGASSRAVSYNDLPD